MDVTRISACSFPLKEKDLDYTFQVISDSGFDKIDLVGRMPHFSVTDPEYDLGALRRAVDTYGVQLANIGSYCGRGFSDPSHDERQGALEEMRKTLDVAKAFGAKSIRIFPGDGTLANMEKVVPYFKESAEHAERAGVYMGIENHGGEISGNPEACKEISERVGSPYFGILYEPCNLMAAGADYKLAFETFKEHIVHVHVKDGKYNEAGKWERCMLGDGEIDYTWVWQQVEGLGYDRDYALEFEVGNIEPVETGYRKWLETWANLT
jgi:L-ribulose-5-phosphate 3-epimerase